MECPYCEKNGIIKKAKVKGLGVTVYLCDECEELWTDPYAIRKNNSMDFGAFMEQRARKGLWSELEEVETNWEAGNGLIAGE